MTMEATRQALEDALTWTMRIHAAGLVVTEVIAKAGDVSAFLTPAEPPKDWQDIARFTAIMAERGRAREITVRLEQELAESERQRIQAVTKLEAYEMEISDLVKGVLMDVRRLGSSKPAPEWAAVCDVVAKAAAKFGVTL